MLGRGRFIQGKMPRTTGTSKGSDDGDAEGVAAAGNGKSPPLPLGASLEQLNRKHSNSMLSPYAAAQLRVGEGGGGGDGYALELQSDCGESVSSMNDSIYFGGGASVTGGYSRRFHSNSNRNSPMLLQKAKSLAVGIVPGTSPDLPINLLGPMHDETSDIRSLESGSRAAFTATQFSLADMEEYTTPMPQKDGSKDGTTAVSPTSVLVSASSNNSESSPQQKYAGGLCCCCCPGWIRRAPTWLKVVFFLSVVLLLGAVALVVVGLFISLHAEESSSENGSLSQGSENAPLFPVTLSPVEAVGSVAVPVAATTAPTVTPTASPLLVKTGSSTPPTLKPAMSNDVKPAPKNPPPPSAAPLVQTAPPSTTVPLVQATVPPTAAPLAQATVPPTAVVPSNDGTLAATVAPTNATQDELKSLLTVYLTAGRYSSALQEQVAATAGSIPDREGTAFMVHLGDWNSPSLTNCNEDTFQQVSNLFLQSSVPVYFVVGDNEYNNCPDPSAAMTLWKDYLLDYETKHWELPPWEIIRQGDSSVAYQAYSENFLFTYGQAAFVSINLGSGEVYSETESQQRHDANLVWIDSAYDFYSKQVSTIFILADDGPPGVSQNTQFYVELLALIESDYKDVEFVLVHRGSSSWGYTEKYGGINNLDVVEVLGPIWPPLRMTVDFGQTKPRITLEDSWN